MITDSFSSLSSTNLLVFTIDDAAGGRLNKPINTFTHDGNKQVGLLTFGFLKYVHYDDIEIIYNFRNLNAFIYIVLGFFGYLDLLYFTNTRLVFTVNFTTDKGVIFARNVTSYVKEIIVGGRLKTLLLLI